MAASSKTKAQTEQDIAYKTGLEQNLRKRKRKKIILRIVLLILLLLLLLLSIGIYFIVRQNQENKELVLNLTFNSYGVVNNQDKQLGKTHNFEYGKGEETESPEEIVVPNFELTQNNYLRLDYEVENLSNITYTYIIDLRGLNNDNCAFKFTTNFTPEMQSFPPSNILRLAYNRNFKFSIYIQIDNLANDATCTGSIIFTVAIM